MPSDAAPSSQGFGDDITESQPVLVAEIMASGMNDGCPAQLWSQHFPSSQLEILNYLSNLMVAKPAYSQGSQTLDPNSGPFLLNRAPEEDALTLDG